VVSAACFSKTTGLQPLMPKLCVEVSYNGIGKDAMKLFAGILLNMDIQ